MSAQAKKTAFLASLGAGLEYYDYIIYGMMAETLGRVFFLGDDQTLVLIKSLSIFALGYFVRPLGGIFFGLLGDTFGRKWNFFAITLLMAISTICIGLLPSVNTIGITASYLLLLFRVLQGLSFGAELPAAITVVSENTAPAKQGFYSSFVISSASSGSLLASFILYVMSVQLTQEQILAWGWRIPFICGGLLGVVNYFVRKHLKETPKFVELQKRRAQSTWLSPIKLLLKEYKKELFLGLTMTSIAAALVIFSIFLPTFLSQSFNRDKADIYLAMMWGMGWSVISVPLCGFIADRVSKEKFFSFACLVFVCSALSLFQFSSLTGMMICYQTFTSCVMATYFPILANVFPTEVRYTGLAVCYNLTYSLMGSLPIVAAYLVAEANSPEPAIYLMMGFALISGIASLALAIPKHVNDYVSSSINL